MKSLHALVWFGLLFCFARLVAQDSTPSPSVAKLGWLAGTWEFERNGRVVREVWMPPAGGTLLGMSRTTKGERTIEYEFLLLGADANGVLTYTARPSGQAGASFGLVSWTERTLVFENLQNDFPKRIGYTLNADGALTAWIEGPGRDGKTRRIEFPYRRGQ